MPQIKIVADSSANLSALEGIEFSSAPLKINTANKEYVDNEQLDVEAMATELLSYKGRSTTSCPNSEDWLTAFGDAENIICITITAALSGAYNSALLAKRQYEETHPERKVFVLNTRSTGPEMKLIAEKIRELSSFGKDFEEICCEIEEYSKKTGLMFVLESLKNLANNGRVSPVVAKVAGILGIRIVGKASDKGELEQMNKCRGEKKALETVIEHLKNFGLSKGKVKIDHCLAESTANTLKENIETLFPQANVTVNKCGGLCSFYAEKGGILIGFEKF